MADRWDEGDSEENESLSPIAPVQFSLSTKSDDLPSDPSYRPKKLKKSGSIIESQDFELYRYPYSRVLVLYTGGTIGMKSHGSDGVYSPEPNFLVPELKKLPMLHDVESGLSGLQLEGFDETDVPLIMPLSKEGKRVFYCVYEYEPLLDSANMTFDDYARLARDIRDNYDRFDAFVILHGTDTMAYTASALSFMIENLGKTVILTGSQIPIFETRSDGRDNFLGALILAGHYCIPEVTVYFHNKLLRGNRSTKADTSNMDAFISHNLPPLAVLEIDINVNWEAIFRPRGLKKLKVHCHMCTNVGILRLFPSITCQTVKAFLQPPMEGVVIQSYGAGNGPDARQDLLAVLKEASDKGMMIVNITQCARGAVMPAYAAGKALVDAGVISGADMTAEAALMKLSFILSKKNLSFDMQKKLMMDNLRGEMKVAVVHAQKSMDFGLFEKLADAMRLSSQEEKSYLRNAICPALICAAARESNITALNKLKAAGFFLAQTDYDGRTALHVAACEGHIEVVKYLLEHGASVHVRDRFGHSALDDAVRFGHEDVVKLLVDTGAHLTMPPSKMGMMLCNTAAHEDVHGLESWFLAGVDVNQGDYSDRTALHVASAMNKKETVKYLLTRGANPDRKDAFGQSPLEEAKQHNDNGLVDMLSRASLTSSPSIESGLEDLPLDSVKDDAFSDA